MNPLPFSSFDVQCKASQSELIERLAANVGKTKWHRWGSCEKKFFGRVTDCGFRIHRTMSLPEPLFRGSSFLPVMCGRFVPHSSGTTVQVRMQLHPIIICLLIFIFAPFLIVTGLVPPLAPFSIFAAVFTYILTWGGFWYEARKSQEALIEFLKENENNGQDGGR